MYTHFNTIYSTLLIFFPTGRQRLTTKIHFEMLLGVQRQLRREFQRDWLILSSIALVISSKLMKMFRLFAYFSSSGMLLVNILNRSIGFKLISSTMVGGYLFEPPFHPVFHFNCIFTFTVTFKNKFYCLKLNLTAIIHSNGFNSKKSNDS